MAGAEIIASGIGILCLIIFGYVLIGGILSTTENAASAQNDYVLMKESQRETAINIPHSSPTPQFGCIEVIGLCDGTPCYNCTLSFDITNTGTEMLGDFNQMDVYVNTSEDIIRGESPFDVIHAKRTVVKYTFNASQIVIGGDEPSSTWAYTQIAPDIIHPNMLDPNEKMEVQINNYRFWIQPVNFMITVVTPNGITDTYYK